MFGAFIVPNPTPTPGIPPSTLGTDAGADMAVVFYLIKLFSSSYPKRSRLEPKDMHVLKLRLAQHSSLWVMHLMV
jgi:hypothetical protein